MGKQGKGRYLRWLRGKIRAAERKGRPTAGLARELSHVLGEVPRPPFATGREAHEVYKRRLQAAAREAARSSGARPPAAGRAYMPGS